MKTCGRFVSIASFVASIVIATATAAIAQGMQGGMGPGTMQGERTSSRTPTSNMPQGGMSQGMMGQGMMCPMMRAMMQGGMSQEMTGPGMTGQGMIGSGMTGSMGGMFGSRVTPIMNLSVDDVRSYVGMQIERLNNNRLKLGNISVDGETINAEIVTVDNSLVQKLKVDRHTGVIEYVN
jgi:hypothetical protein